LRTSVEGDADHALPGGPVIGDVAELEAGNLDPSGAVEYL